MISTKGRYAIRFMIDLAEQQEGFPVPLEDSLYDRKYPESIWKLLLIFS